MIWIPNDRLGISDDEISRVRQYDSNVKINYEHAGLYRKGRVTITQNLCGSSRNRTYEALKSCWSNSDKCFISLLHAYS